jgi:hypothetical protein
MYACMYGCTFTEYKAKRKLYSEVKFKNVFLDV